MDFTKTKTKLNHRRSKFHRSHYEHKRKPFIEKRPDHFMEGLGVKVLYRGESADEKMQAIDRALSQLKKLLSKEGVLQEMRERRYFVSKGRQRYLKRRQIIHKRQTKLQKRNKKFRKRKWST